MTIMPAHIAKTQLDVGPLASHAKHELKDSLLTVLNKLGERDTQQKAQGELGSFVRVRRYVSVFGCTYTGRPSLPEHLLWRIEGLLLQGLDVSTLGVFVSCLCATGIEQKVLARKVGFVPLTLMRGYDHIRPWTFAAGMHKIPWSTGQH